MNFLIKVMSTLKPGPIVVETAMLITRLDRSFTILYANDGYLNMVGYTRSQLRKEKRNAAVSLCASEERNATMQAIFNQLSQNGMLSLEHRLQRRDGTRLWALIRGLCILHY